MQQIAVAVLEEQHPPAGGGGLDGVGEDHAPGFQFLPRGFDGVDPQCEMSPARRAIVGGGRIPKQNFGNINVTWENIGGLPVDLSAYVTNVTNQKIILHLNTQETQGLRSGFIGEPRMYGFRAKVRF